MELVDDKNYYIERLIGEYSNDKLKCRTKPDVIDFKRLMIRITKDKLFYYYSDSTMIPRIKIFDLTEEEHQRIINETCKWKKRN